MHLDTNLASLPPGSSHSLASSQMTVLGLEAAMFMAWPIIANSVTLPYYRFYRQNTLLPILALARRVRDGDDDHSISERLRHWQDRKLDEFKFVATAVCIWADMLEASPSGHPFLRRRSAELMSYLRTHLGHHTCCSSDRLLLLADSRYRILARPSMLVLKPRHVLVLGASLVIRGIHIYHHPGFATKVGLAEGNLHDSTCEEQGHQAG